MPSDARWENSRARVHLLPAPIMSLSAPMSGLALLTVAFVRWLNRFPMSDKSYLQIWSLKQRNRVWEVD